MVLCRLFGVPLEETSAERRGFQIATEAMRARLELVGKTFLDGYHAALKCYAPPVLAARLNSVDAELRGFAFEGAAMGLALLDTLTPWRATRVSNFLSGAGSAHAYMVHVGVGWAWARFAFGFRRFRRRLDPLLSWLAFDGWGFHEGFFHWPKYITGEPLPRRLTGYERRVFDQGLGRSWWFVNGGNPELIARTIGKLPAERHPDMWSGVGLAATYAAPSARTHCEACESWRVPVGLNLPKVSPSPPKPASGPGFSPSIPISPPKRSLVCPPRKPHGFVTPPWRTFPPTATTRPTRTGASASSGILPTGQS